MENTIFRRKAYTQLLQWKEENKGKTAVLVEGARRIGKSTIVEEFARNEYESYLLIDFNEASKTTKALFEDLSDLDYLLINLQATYHKTLTPHKSVIIFDEVQQCPLARQAIKYLVADGRYDYIETGSLISIKKNVADITLPSEEDRIQMHPMDYEEFRWALGDDSTMPLLHQFWEKKHALGAAHRTMMRDLRLYMLVGGMPQAVSTYIKTKNLHKVDEMKRKIIRLYADDFMKIDSSGRVSRLFMAIPSALSRNASRYVSSSVIGTVEEEKMTELLRCLEDSKTVNFAFHSNDPNVGMALTKDESRYKLFVCDTGLFVTLAFWDKSFTENIIYEKLLGDRLPANLGYVYENLVAQMLVAAGNELYYHIWPKDDKHNYEIDFLVAHGNKIQPIEVKSSGYKTHASLDAFCKKFSSRIGERMLLYTKDYQKDGATTCIPVYFTPFL